MSCRTALLIPAFAAVLLPSCGGGTAPREPASEGVKDPYGGSAGSPAALVSRELTSALDERTMSSNAPASSEFLPDTAAIYFLATLEGLPAQSQIEVEWLKATSDRPIYISRTAGSDTHTFFSKLRPESDGFEPGNYRVVVRVNGAGVGDAGFRVVDRRGGAMVRVKELSVSTAVEVNTNKPLKKMTSFPRGVKQVYASFFVGGVEPGATIRVIWSRDGNQLDMIDVECDGERYYAVPFEVKKGMPPGDWEVDVDILGEIYASRSFHVGDNSGYPVIEKAALGTSLGKGNIPKKAMTRFKRGTGAISCGIQFYSVPDNATVDVEWISLTEGGEMPLQSTSTAISKGGVASVGLTWKTGGKLKPGPHKAVISVNNSKLHEIAFTVE